MPAGCMASLWTLLLFLIGTAGLAAAASCRQLQATEVESAFNFTKLDNTLSGCLQLSNVCTDHSAFILFNPQYSPIGTNRLPLPTFNVSQLDWNWPNPYGNGDRFSNGARSYASPIIRSNSSAECCADLVEPSFSRDMVPLIFYQQWPFNFGESILRGFAQLWWLQKEGAFGRSITLVVATPDGHAMPTFTRRFLQSLSNMPVITLADLSNRPGKDVNVTGCRSQANSAGEHTSRRALQSTANPGSGAVAPRGLSTLTAHGGRLLTQAINSNSESAATPSVSSSSSSSAAVQEAVCPQRCFSRAVLCQNSLRVERPVYPAVQAFIRPYLAKLAPVTNVPNAHDVLKVVFEQRPHAGKLSVRRLLNQRQLLDTCNAWDLSQDAAQMGALWQEVTKVVAGDMLRGRGGSHQDGSMVSLARSVDASADDGETSVQLDDLEADGQDGEEEGSAGFASSEVGGLRRMAVHQVPVADREHNGRGVGDGGSSTLDSGSNSSRWRSAECTAHQFGGDFQTDLSILQAADVLVCVHGATCNNAFYMRPGSSLLEIRPYRMWWGQADGYMNANLRKDIKVFWWGLNVVNASHCLRHKGMGKNLNNHVILPWQQLKHSLLGIASVGRQRSRYRTFRRSGRNYVSDTLEVIPRLRKKTKAQLNQGVHACPDKGHNASELSDAHVWP